jgi:hypothetical protein
MGSWIVFAVQVTLSLITLAIGVLSFVWVRSSAREGRETKRLLENLSALFNRLYGATNAESSALVAEAPAKTRRGGVTPAPVELESMTEPQRRQALTIEMVRPGVPVPTTSESSPPLAVKLGAEIVELDAETIARIEALAGDVNAGRMAGDLLQRVIDAGLANAERGDRISGEVRREPRAGDSDEHAPGRHGEERPTEETPGDTIPLTTPTKPTR